jgi:glycine betaine/proline transport system permease protein
MWSIPLGQTFEAIIDWLKDNVTFLFDAIHAVLDYSIRALERILLLDHSAVYPSLIIGLFVGLLFWRLGRRWLPQVPSIALGAVVLVAFLGLEGWRYQTLEAQMTPDEARAFVADLQAYEASLQAVAPDNYEPAEAIFEEAEALAPDDRDYVRSVGRIGREVGRLRPGEYEDAAEVLGELREFYLSGEAGVTLPPKLAEEIDTLQAYYHAFVGIEEAERLARRFEGEENAVNRYEVVNARSYEDGLAILDASIAEADALGVDDAVLESWKELRSTLTSYNPETLGSYPWLVVIVLLTILAYLCGGYGLALFTVLGNLLIVSMGYWDSTMETLALVIASTFFALLIGIPAGIGSARSSAVNSAIRPFLDFMQTMPAFVYLIPAVLFFGLGRVPGAIATLIFAMPPAVRLTALGIRQVPQEVVEAAQAFGATPRQMLLKAQLPIAMPTILAGLNQTIMLALSMVVIGGMIGAGGLGEDVLSGITQMKIDVGFESGVAVVILAIFLDRVTQRLGGARSS